MKFTLLFLAIFVGCNSAIPELSSISGVSQQSGKEVKVEVQGLNSETMSVSLNGESTLNIQKDGIYSFPKHVREDLEFEVAIMTPPTNRNCAVVNPKGDPTSKASLVRIFCDDNGFLIRGFITGSFPGGLKLDIDGLPLEVPESATSYLYPKAFAAPRQLRIVSPKTCTFINDDDEISAVPSTGRYDIWCGYGEKSTKSVTLTADNLVAGDTIHVARSSNSSAISITAAGFPTISYESNRREVFEIISTPDGKRCFFKNTLNHLYVLEGETSRIELDCRARQLCESSGIEFPAVDGKLNDVTCSNDYFAYGGKFSRFGRQHGIVSILRAGAALAASANRVFDRIHGKVNKIIPDGKNGFFVAGSFNRVGDANRYNLVRLSSQLTIDPLFAAGTDGEVHDLIYRDNELFIFGDFTNVFVGSNRFPRSGFAKITLTSQPEKVSPVSIPHLPRLPYVSAALFGWNIYFHTKIGSTSASYVLNKNTGAFSRIVTNANEKGNTLYWKDLQNKVWMINETLGLVDPLTLKGNPLEGTKNVATLPGRVYTLIGNRLYQTAPDRIDFVDLNLLGNGAVLTNFAETSTGGVNQILNAGTAFERGSELCFLQRKGTAFVGIASDTANQRKSLACYKKDAIGSVSTSSFSVSSMSVPTYALQTDVKIYLNSQFYSSETANSFAFIYPKTMTSKSFTGSFPPETEINAFDRTGTHIYIGGSFPQVSSCTTCKNLTRLISIGSPALDTSWYPETDLNEGPVTNLSVSGNYLYASTGFPNPSLLALDVNAPQLQTREYPGVLISKLHGLGNKVAYAQNLAFMIREFNLEPSPTLSMTGALKGLEGTFTIAKDQVVLTEEPYLQIYSRTNITVPTSTISSYNFNPSELKLTSAGNNVCYYDLKNFPGCSSIDSVWKFEFNTLKSFKNDDYTVFKGIGNYLFVAKEFSSPTILFTIPDTGP